MKKTTDLRRTLIVDYSAARAQAIRWLGDRYLLAKPINATGYSSRKLAPVVTPPARATIGREDSATP